MIPDSTGLKGVQELYTYYLAALLEGDYAACSSVVNGLLDDGTDVREIYEGLFQRSLYEVGSLWEKNQISVATEHLATSTTESLMTLVYPHIFSQEHIDRRVIVSCAANEYHQLGGRMVADMFELRRWHAHFLGADTPVDDLILMIEEKKPDLVALSVSLFSNIPKAEQLVKELRNEGMQIPVIVGGQAFRWGGTSFASRYDRVRILSSLSELDDYIQKF